MTEVQKFCLKWNDFKGIITSAFDNLRHDEELVDVTLCCEGKTIKAHKMMLSACSPYFKQVLKENPCQHPVFFMRDISYSDMSAVMEFVYRGEVNVSQATLASFLKTAEMLQVKGLTDDGTTSNAGQPDGPSPQARGAAYPPIQSRPQSQQPPQSHQQSTQPPAPAATGRQKRAASSGGLFVPEATPSSAPSSPAAKRSRPDGVPTLGAATPPAAAEAGQDGLPPPSPRTDAAGRLHRATVKTEQVEVEVVGGDGLEAVLDAEVDYDGVLTFAGAVVEDQLAAASQDSAGPAPQGMEFFPDGSVSGRSVDVEQDVNGRPGLAMGRPCLYCGKMYRHRQSLHKHVQMHRGKTKCHMCAETLSTVEALRNHLKLKHGAPLPDPVAY